jgi:hypothetical protein
MEAEAAETAEATLTAGAPKEFVVFFGLDVFANDGTRPRPVVDASGHEVLVMDQDGTKPVPLEDARLKAEVVPKLSRVGVTIAHLDGEPVYSAEADPMAQARAQQMMLSGLQDHAREQADVALWDANQRLTQAQRARDANIIDDAALANAAQNVNSAAARLDDVHATPTLGGELPGSGDRGAGHDGFAVSFRASAPEPHARAYGVVRLRIHPPGQPEVTVQALKTFRLRELTAKPRKFMVRIFDLPPGYTVESYQVHVYADGNELATNLSSNRVELTADEAHQYLIMRHAHLNRAATLPAQVLADLAPRAAPSGLIAGQESMLVNLGITAEGRVDQVGGDAAISATLSPQLQAALREVRFLPALVDGQPAASTGTFALGELFLSP